MFKEARCDILLKAQPWYATVFATCQLLIELYSKSSHHLSLTFTLHFQNNQGHLWWWWWWWLWWWWWWWWWWWRSGHKKCWGARLIPVWADRDGTGLLQAAQPTLPHNLQHWKATILHYNIFILQYVQCNKLHLNDALQRTHSTWALPAVHHQSAVRSELEPVPVFCNGVQLYTALPFASIATFCQLGQNRVEAFFGADEDERQAD